MKISYTVADYSALVNVASRMSEADAIEVMACSGYTPEQAVLESASKSDFCIIASWNGKPQAVFGLLSQTFEGVVVGSPWMLATEDVHAVPREFLKQSRLWVKSFTETCDILFNMVDARHTRAMRWLEWLGFTSKMLHESYGVGQVPFHEMVLEKNV